MQNARIICCDFEFMHVNLEKNMLCVVTEKMKKKKKSQKPDDEKKTKKVPFVMSSGLAEGTNKEVFVKRFLSGLPSDAKNWTEEVCINLHRQLLDYRPTQIKENDIVVVWDKNGDKEFIDAKNEIVDLREIFRHLKLLKFPTFCSKLEPSEQKKEMGLKDVAKRFLTEYKDVNCTCQTGDWNNPSNEMMDYAVNDVVLLQDLIEFAKARFGCKTFNELWMIAKENKDIMDENIEWFEMTKQKAFAEAKEISKRRVDLSKQERGKMLEDANLKIGENFKKIDMEPLYNATSAFFAVYFIGEHSGQHILTMYDYEKEDCEELFLKQMIDIGVDLNNIRMKHKLKLMEIELDSDAEPELEIQSSVSSSVQPQLFSVQQTKVQPEVQPEVLLEVQLDTKSIVQNTPFEIRTDARPIPPQVEVVFQKYLLKILDFNFFLVDSSDKKVTNEIKLEKRSSSSEFSSVNLLRGTKLDSLTDVFLTKSQEKELRKFVTEKWFIANNKNTVDDNDDDDSDDDSADCKFIGYMLQLAMKNKGLTCHDGHCWMCWTRYPQIWECCCI